MIKENKLKYLISSILIMLPSLTFLFMKDSFAGVMKGAWYFSWILPLVMLLLHTTLLIITRYIDPVKQSKKIENIIFFTMPAVTLYTYAIVVAIVLGLEINVAMVCAVLLGVAFIVIGNYMPKSKRNRTFGIKIKWTMANDDNWTATHRFGGKIMVIGGVLTLLAAFLPIAVVIAFLIAELAVMVIAPTVYSYRFYKKQIETGEATEEDYAKESFTFNKQGKVVLIISVVAVVLVCALMFSGSIGFEFTDDALKITPSLGAAFEIEYSDLEGAEIEYRESNVDGTRVMGYASSKILYGYFNNSEFGSYTRYTYARAEATIIIRTAEGIIVLADESAEKTRAIYDGLMEKISATGN